MFQFYNANPRGKRVNDCTIRAIACATGKKWDDVYRELSEFARAQAVMPDEVSYIDEYLERHFTRVSNEFTPKSTVGEFADMRLPGRFVITMNGHITCCIDGTIYDTFDPSSRVIWNVYKVKI